MKTEFNEDNAANVAVVLSFTISILATCFFFWPMAGAIADMVRDKELNPIAGFLGFSLFGGIAPIGSFFVVIFVFAFVGTKVEEVVFARNRKFKEIAEFIIEARGNK